MDPEVKNQIKEVLQKKGVAERGKRRTKWKKWVPHPKCGPNGFGKQPI